MKATPAPRQVRAAAAAVLAAAMLALGGCSDRDTLLAEKVAAADAAALRAQQAAERAEAAVRQAHPAAAATPAPVEDSINESAENPELAEQQALDEASAATDASDQPNS